MSGSQLLFSSTWSLTPNASLQRMQCRFERQTLIGSCGLRKQSFVGRDRQIESGRVIFGARKTHGVVGERGTRELILRKLA